MAVADDVRRLIQLDFVFAGVQLGGPTIWYKGRLQQANDNAIIFRSISQDGTVVGMQIGTVQQNWESNERIGIGIQVVVPVQGLPVTFILQQALPQELT